MKDKKDMNNNKLIIIMAVIIVVLLLAIILLLLLTKQWKNNSNKNDDTTATTTTIVIKEYATITFNSNGGDPIQPTKFKIGEKVKLPIPNSTDHEFLYWSDENDIIYNEETSFEDDITLTANWKEKNVIIKTMKITFDSKGGTKVNPMTIKCENESADIKSYPKNPTRDNYTFNAWQDKKGNVIFVGARLACENTTLYASWNKAENTNTNLEINSTTTTETTTTTTSTTTKIKTYRCPEGFTLDTSNNTCYDVKDPELNCPEGATWDESIQRCYKLLGQPDLYCNEYMGHGLSESFYFNDRNGHEGCAWVYKPEYTTRETCEVNHGYNYGDYLPYNHCWQYVKYGSDASPYIGRQCSVGGAYYCRGNKCGCYLEPSKEWNCINYNGYTLNSGGKCVKRVNATEQ